MDSVLQLLDELEDVMDSSKAVPFSSKVTVNKEEIYDIISEIRMKLPNELNLGFFRGRTGLFGRRFLFDVQFRFTHFCAPSETSPNLVVIMR